VVVQSRQPWQDGLSQVLAPSRAFFAGGPCKDRFQSGSRVVPGWFQGGSRVVPGWFQGGSRWFMRGWFKGVSRVVPGWFMCGWFQGGSSVGDSSVRGSRVVLPALQSPSKSNNTQQTQHSLVFGFLLGFVGYGLANR